jgi:hypothetical protein
MKKNWPLFGLMSVGGIVSGTLVAILMLYVLGFEITTNLLLTCLGLTAAISVVGSFAWWPILWRK